MKIIGIVAEYNPFHEGHAYHIEASRNMIQEDSTVVCVMSGDFVQRGESAIFSKHARARAAVTGGADLVLELPLPWSLMSAEGFARGSVAIFGALGCVDYLSFGSESGTLEPLETLAKSIMEPSFIPRVRYEMKEGISFPAARQRVLESELGEVARLLESPNNTLAVEYLRAILEMQLRVSPMTISRKGVGHDQPGGSASDIRKALSFENTFSDYVPQSVRAVLEGEIRLGRGPVTAASLETAVVSRLRMLNEENFLRLPDAGEGLGNRLFTAVQSEPTLDGILAVAKTKRYTLSRLRRMLMCAALGISAVSAESLPPYARVLAGNEKGRAALRLISDKSTIPVVTKPAAAKQLSQECREVLELGSRAHDLFVLGYRARDEKRGGADYRAVPAMLD